MKLLVTVAPFSTLQISENAVQKGVVQSVLPTTGASNERYEASHVKHAFKSPPVAIPVYFCVYPVPAFFVTTATTSAVAPLLVIVTSHVAPSMSDVNVSQFQSHSAVAIPS